MNADYPVKPCFRCRAPSVIFQRYSGRHLCALHLKADVLARVKRTIRLDGGLGKRPVIAFLWEGQACYCLLHVMGEITGRRPGMEFVIFHQGMSLNLVIDKLSLPSSIRIRTEDITGRKVKNAVLLSGADRLVRCTTLDEEAEQVLNSLLSGKCSSLFESENASPVTCLRPFREIPAGEIELVARELKALACEDREDLSDAGLFLESLTKSHPSVPFSLIRYKDRLCDLELSRSEHD